jgi:aryl-phospho-beta-D-glucosidase BglC (GH1 family)
VGLVLAVGQFVSVPAAQSAVVAPSVRSSGTAFVDATGRPVILRGVNVAAGNSAAMENATVATGANFVRIRVAWSQVEPSAPVNGVHAYNQTFLHGLDAEVAWYQAHGVNVMIDFHQFFWSTYWHPYAQGIPAWFYTVTRPGYPTTDAGMLQAEKDWYTDMLGAAYYRSFVTMMAQRYGAYPAVVGYNLLNEPMCGSMPWNAACEQTIVNWEGPVARAIRAVDSQRTVFFILDGGGDLGLSSVNLSPFGGLQHVAVDLHDYYNGAYGSGVSADGLSFVPSWDATHNQRSLSYHGTEQNLEANLRVVFDRTQLLGIPLVIGEWGVQTADSGAATYQAQMLDLLDRYQLSWARWALSTTDAMRIVNSDWSLNSLGLQLRAGIAAAVSAPAQAPVMGAAPSIAGAAVYGSALTGSPGSWTGAADLTYSWRRCDTAGASCSAIPDADSPSYTPAFVDIGCTLRELVVAGNGAGSTVAVSTPTGVVSAGPLAVLGLNVNPSPVTTWAQFGFDLNQAATVSVVVEDASGAVIRKQVTAAAYSGGPHTVGWALFTDGSGKAGTGTYTVIVTAHAATATVTASRGFDIV